MTHAEEMHDGAVSSDITRHEKTAEEIQPYTIFTSTEKSLLLYGCSVSATFSTLSSFIYFPAITSIAESLNISIQSVNFTITSYQVVSGIAPSLFGTLADDYGRRPVLLFTLSLYLGANIGLALANHYVILLVMRCLQSAGASSTIAVAYGIIADISIPSERGSFVGVLLGFINAAPCLGPVIGGVVSDKLSWEWIFWLLTITSGAHLIILAIFLPETSRKLVGNGDQRPPLWINRSLFAILFRRYPQGEAAHPSKSFDFLSPIKGLKTLYDKANFIVILVGGITYTIYGCLATSLSAQVIHIYSLQSLTAGLTYLPAGIGGMIAALLGGRLLDYEYRVTARKHNIPLSSQPVTRFPVEKARLRSVFPAIVISSITTLGYGWTLHARPHLAVLMVLQFCSGATQVLVFVVCGTLLTDLNSSQSSTVQASYNIIRCSLSAAGIAAVDAMIRGMGVGWCFTAFAIWGTVCVPLLYVLRKKGESWRSEAVLISPEPPLEKGDE